MNSKKTLIFAGAGTFLVLAAAAFGAVGPDYTIGGIGQIVGDTQTFQIAVCNHSGKNTVAPIPVTVSANGAETVFASTAPINDGQCAYSTVAYSALNLQPGGRYNVDIVVANGNETTYMMTVPDRDGGVVPSARLAETGFQAGDFLSWLRNFFFGWLK